MTEWIFLQIGSCKLSSPGTALCRNGVQQLSKTILGEALAERGKDILSGTLFVA
jgi:hypothetical protein